MTGERTRWWPPRWSALRRPIPRWTWWTAGALAVAVALAYAGAFLADEPMRRSMERELNERLKGYEVRVGRLDLHPFGWSLDLEDVVLTQTASPDPPVARIPRLTASVHWRALLSGSLVGEIEIVRPLLHVNLAQARKEIADPVPIRQRGWQEALEAIYPLKINLFTVEDGALVYTDEGPFKPLHLDHVNVRATNIRNIRSAKGTYPSELRAEAQVFDEGRLTLDGHADFLAAPHPAVRAEVRLERIELDYFRPLTRHYDVLVKGGVLSAAGAVEYAPTVKALELRDAEIAGVTVEYVHKVRGTRVEERMIREAGRAAGEVADKPGVLIRVERLQVTGSTFALANTAADPDYRLFIDDVHMTVRDISNQRDEGVGAVELKGRFMGTGATLVELKFRPARPRPDVDARVQIVDAQMRSMNELFKAHGGFDVVGGEFSFFSEIRVNKGVVAGYVKPLFKDVDVYDPRQDRQKGAFRRAYESVVEALAALLRNRPREEVATRVTIRGHLDDPQFSTLEAVLGLVRNAFLKAIVPGFERRGGR